MLSYGSVCSGIEAATQAWHGFGWRPAWFAEIEPFPSAVLAHHYPEVPNLGDMTKIAARIAAGEIAAPDVLVGGTPCQAFSVAGLRGGLSDARGQLTLSYVELANAIDTVRTFRREQPAIVVWENVPGVLSSKDNAFGCFLAGLAGESCELKPPGRKWSNAGCVLGPQRAVAWRILDAQYFGVAQRRRRVFVVASARDGFDPVQVLFEFDGARRDSAPSREAGKETSAGTLRRTDGGSDVDHARAGHLIEAFGGNNQSGPIDVATARNACASASGRMDFETETFLVQPTHTLRGEGFDASEDSTGRRTPLVPVAFDTTQITSQANRSNPQPGDPCHPLAAGAHAPSIAYAVRTANTSANGHGVAEEVTHTLDQAQRRAIAFPANLSGTQHASTENLSPALGAENPTAVAHVGIMPTMTAGGPSESSHNQVSGQTRDAYMVPTTTMQVRRLTPRECERLQGFPDDYTLIPWKAHQAWAKKKGTHADGKSFEEWLIETTGRGLRQPTTQDCPDGPRYKALGNSMAVPCMAWIGRRIQAQVK